MSGKIEDKHSALDSAVCQSREDSHLFSNKVNTSARLESQKAESIAISLVSASSAELRRCACAPSKALHNRQKPFSLACQHV